MQVLSRVAQLLRIGAMICLVAMMLVTTVDISMRLAINRLVLGSVEIVSLTIVAVVFLALPETFLRNQHIVVDAVDEFVSVRVRGILQFCGALLTAVLLTVMAVRMVPIAFDTLRIGDLSTDLQISLFWYWLPILVGSICAAVMTIVIAVRAYRAMGSADIDSPEESQSVF